MKRIFLAIAFCFFAAGCFQRPTQDEITRSAANSKAAPAAAAAKPDQPTPQAPAVETKKRM